MMTEFLICPENIIRPFLVLAETNRRRINLVSKYGKAQQQESFALRCLLPSPQKLTMYKIMPNSMDSPLPTPELLEMEFKIRLAKEGQAAIPCRTVMQTFDTVVKNYAGKPALFQKVLNNPVSSKGFALIIKEASNPLTLGIN